jgi:putative two-component system response regulator
VRAERFEERAASPIRILVVEDEADNAALVEAILSRNGYAGVWAADAAEARRCLEREDFALVLCDVNLPDENGIELARGIVLDRPDTAVVMVSGVEDRAVTASALALGAYGYVLKPYRTSDLLINISSALRRRDLELENRAYRSYLEREVERRTAETERAKQETIRRLAWAAEHRDQDTGRHLERMSATCALVARQAGLDEERCEEIALASALHDVGKIAIPDRILRKRGPLSARDWDVMKRHPEIGYRMLAGSPSPLLDLAATIALTHHERVDGGGYPLGLSGDEIPLEGRCAAIADVFDALTSDRVYRPALPVEEAVNTMLLGRGKHFDPILLDLFLASLDDVAWMSGGTRVDPGGEVQQPLEVERLREVFRRPRLEEALDVRGRGLGAHHGDRDPGGTGIGPEPPQDLLAGEVGKMQVEQDRVGEAFGGESEPGRPVDRGEDLEAAAVGESALDEDPVRLDVLDAEDEPRPLGPGGVRRRGKAARERPKVDERFPDGVGDLVDRARAAAGDLVRKNRELGRKGLDLR